MSRTPEDVARLIEQMAEAAHDEGSTIGDTYRLADVLAEWADEVRAETLAGFEWETTPHFHLPRGGIEQGYRRLVGRKRYMALPESPSAGAVQELRRRLGVDLSEEP